jgi:tRNA pseudouridine13 synthase
MGDIANGNENLDSVADLPYLTADVPGIGGAIKTFLEDFFVEEVPLYEPIDEGPHVFFCIEKRQIDTLKAVRVIADALGRRAFDIGAAGLKDARAVSRQVLSVEHAEPETLMRLQLPGIRVLWARRHRNKLRLGHLKGNRFIIKLRDVPAARAANAEATLAALRRRGVPNYFGPQRFGIRGDSWQIGRAIVKQDAREAIDVLLGRPNTADSPAIYKARQLYESDHFREAAAIWPYNCREERIALKAMMKAKGSHRRALWAIDRSVRRLYVSAFQSWLFNQVVAERVRLDALDKLWTGDLAWLHDRGAVFLVEDAAAEQPRADRLEISPSGPLFGSRTTIARGRAGEMETTLLAAQQVTAQDFRNVKGQKVRGARRPLRFPLSEFDFAAGNDEHGPYFEFRFYLPAGCYATSLLREICKTDVRTAEESGAAAEQDESEE